MAEIIQSVQKLYDLLLTTDFSLDKLEEELETGQYSADDVSLAGYKYVDDCICDVSDGGWTRIERNFGEVLSGYPSSHMMEALEVLLRYGLDPNRVFGDGIEDDNIMIALRFVENGYIAADTLALLLEHGANPSLKINGSSLTRYFNTDLLFDLVNQEDRVRYDAFVHFWMVFVGYGARLEDGRIPFDLCEGHSISELKNHRDIYYGAIRSDRSEDHMEICFFNKYTYWEIGRF